jgi:hypothetical protein
MRGIGRFKPSAVSRRFCVAAGFDRTCVLDGLVSVGAFASQQQLLRSLFV